MIDTYIEIFIEVQRLHSSDDWNAYNLCAMVYNGTEDNHNLFPYTDKRFLSDQDFANHGTDIYYWSSDSDIATRIKVHDLRRSINDWYGDKHAFYRVGISVLSTTRLYGPGCEEAVAAACRKYIYKNINNIKSFLSSGSDTIFDESIEFLLDPIQKSITIPADKNGNEKVTYALYKPSHDDVPYKPCIIHTRNEKNREDISEYTDIRFPLGTAIRTLFKEMEIFYPDRYKVESYARYDDNEDDLIIPIFTIGGSLLIDTKIYEYIDKFSDSFKDIINEHLQKLQKEYEINIDNEVIKIFGMAAVKKSTETTKTNPVMAETKTTQKKSMMHRMIDKMADKIAPTIDQSVQVTMDGQIAVPVGEDEFITITEDNQLVSLMPEAVLPLPAMAIPTKQENVQAGDTIIIDGTYYKVLGNTSKGMKCLSYKGTSSTKHTVIEPLVGGAVVKVIKTILNSNSNMNNTGIFGNMQNMLSMVFLTEMMNGKGEGEGSGNMMEKIVPLYMMGLMPAATLASAPTPAPQPASDTAMMQAIAQTLAGVAQALGGITATLDKIDHKIDNANPLINSPLTPGNPTCNGTKADPQPVGTQITY